MTYIVGIKAFGMSAIIADTRVTQPDGAGVNTALKTGFLHPGAMFGIAGYLHDADALIAVNTLSDQTAT